MANANASGRDDGTGNNASKSGVHDLMNVNTWVCAICKKYDPVLPPDADPSEVSNTEWVGCDCNRWFHLFCTKLSDSELEVFNCSQVK